MVVVGVGVAVFWQIDDGVDARCCTECRWSKNAQHWKVESVRREQSCPVTAGGEAGARFSTAEASGEPSATHSDTSVMADSAALLVAKGDAAATWAAMSTEGELGAVASL